MLCLANNTCVKDIFGDLQTRFNSLYRKGSGPYTHHYYKYIDKSYFTEALENTSEIINLYQEMENVKPPEKIPKLRPVI
jgi:tubulin epsilon